MISAKSAKKLTCVTCTASLLLPDLTTLSSAQTIEPDPEPDPGPSAKNPRIGDRHPERSADTVATPVAQPEPVLAVEPARQPEVVVAATYDDRPIAIAAPETIPSAAEPSSPQLLAQTVALTPAAPKANPAKPIVVQSTPLKPVAKPSTPETLASTRWSAPSRKATDLGTQPIELQPVQVTSKSALAQSSVTSQTTNLLSANENQATPTPNTTQQQTSNQKSTNQQLIKQEIINQTREQTSNQSDNQISKQSNTAQVTNKTLQSPQPLQSTIAVDRPIANTQTNAIAQTPTEPTESTTSEPPTILPRAAAKFSTNDWIGNPGPFFGAGGFVPLRQTPGKDITFAEGQMLVPTDGGVGGNLVIGHRIYDQKSDRIYGGYLAYDHRNTGDSSFNQVGLGAEMLGKTWDIRANAYFPVGDTRKLTSESVTNTASSFSNPFFQGNFLAINRTLQQQVNRHYEAAATSIDVEAGGKVAKLGKNGELRGYGGLYYINAPGSDGAIGIRTRLEARPTDTVNVGLGFSSDRIFGTSVALTVGVNLPTTQPRREELKEPFLARLGESVNRNSNIIVEKQKESFSTTIQDTRLVTNPATGQPWRFRHANVGIGTGDGTFENPTGTVAAALGVAQPNDIVYVQPGTNPGIPAFTIPDGVQVLSTGPNQFINTVEFGNLQLPLSGAGILPTVTGTVTLGNNTTLSGFAISTATGPGILGNNISQVTVRDNVISNTATEGVLLNNTQGQVQFFDNTIRQAQGDGFALRNNQGQVDLLLTRNQITNNGAGTLDGDGVNVELRSGATGNFIVTNNTIANNTSGARGLADGIDVKLFDGSNGNFTVADNAITGNQLNGLAINLESAAQGTFNVARNNLSGNGLSGVAALLSDDARMQLNLDSNAIANNQLRGVQVIAAERTQATVNLTNNTINNNQDDGVLLQSSDQAGMNATLRNNTITNNANYGIFTNATGTSQFRILAGNNIITGNGLPGVSINTADNANTAASLQSNTITGNAFSDLEVFNTDLGATACLQPLNNTIGTLILDDFFGGPLSVEAGTLPTNSVTNSDTTFWSGSTVPAGTCGF